MNANLDLVKRLSNVGGKLNVRTNYGLNPLHLSAWSQNPAIVAVITFFSFKFPDMLM